MSSSYVAQLLPDLDQARLLAALINKHIFGEEATQKDIDLLTPLALKLNEGIRKSE